MYVFFFFKKKKKYKHIRIYCSIMYLLIKITKFYYLNFVFIIFIVIINILIHKYINNILKKKKKKTYI